MWSLAEKFLNDNNNCHVRVYRLLSSKVLKSKGSEDSARRSENRVDQMAKREIERRKAFLIKHCIVFAKATSVIMRETLTIAISESDTFWAWLNAMEG